MKHKKLITAIVLLSLLVIYFWKVVFLGRVLSSTDNLFSYPPYNTIAPLGWTHASNPLLGDQTAQFYPFLHFARENIRNGHLPLWNPYIMMGAPFLADAQSAVFYPVNLVFYTFPFKDAFAISAFIRLFIAGFGMFFFIDALGVGFFASLFSAVVFMFCAYNIVWLSLQNTNVAIFLPWIFFFIHQFINKRGMIYFAGLALITGIQFLGGHPETSAHILLAASLYVLSIALWEFKDGKNSKDTLKKIASVGLAFILGFMIASPMLLPFLSELLKSKIWAFRASKSMINYNLPLRAFPELLIPKMFGSPLHDNFWGTSNFNLQSGYIGIIPLILAIMASVVRRKDRDVIFFASLAVGSILIVYSIPPFIQVFNLLPFYNHMANYVLLLTYQFSMIVLAAKGLDLFDKIQPVRLTNASSNEEQPLTVSNIASSYSAYPQIEIIRKTGYKMAGIVFLLAVGSIILTLTLNGKVSAPHIESILDYFYGFLLVIIIFLIWLFLFNLIKYKQIAFIIIITIAFLDIYSFGHNYNPQVPKSWVYPQAPYPISYLENDHNLFRFIGIGPIYLTNSLMVYHVSDVRGYDFPVNQRYDRFFTHLFNQEPFPHPGSASYLIINSNDNLNNKMFKFTRIIQQIFQLINVKYVGIVGKDQLYKIYNYRQRAYLVHYIIPAGTPDQALNLVSMDIDDLLKDSAVIEEKGNAIQMPDCASGMSADTVRVTTYQPDKVELTTFSPCKSILVLSDTYDSGWHVSVDGHTRPILHANYLFRGVVLEPGMHEVIFTYMPLSFIIGLILCFSGIIIVIVVFIYAKKRKQPAR